MDRLERYIDNSVIDAEILVMQGSTHSAEEAAETLGVSTDCIIKSLVFLVDEEPMLVIVQGSKRVDMDALKDLLAADDVDMAERDEVEEITGYSVGEVPPISLGLQKVVDEDVLDFEEVIGGGGATNKLVRLDPRFIVDEDTIVGDITE
jgi:prolyl-tRNA editing enzyme YbaK/EbsC (Cys-tRNA(Pro) deacylase)